MPELIYVMWFFMGICLVVSNYITYNQTWNSAARSAANMTVELLVREGYLVHYTNEKGELMVESAETIMKECPKCGFTAPEEEEDYSDEE